MNGVNGMSEVSGMRVLSLFDGMSCGMIALMNAGVKVDRYVAYEIDKYAIKTSLHNFPMIEQKGDVFSADFTEYRGFDWLVGGSPCTYWSIAQTKNRETTASGLGWELFSQYVRALHEAKPKYFIYENNKSMAKAIRDQIRETFGFEEICINSALVSAQNRQRYYWVGKRNEDGTYSKVNVEQPADRGILLRDVLDNAYSVVQTTDKKSYCLVSSYYKGVGNNPFEYNLHHQQRSVVAEAVRVGCMPSPDGTIKNSQANRVYGIDAKSVNQVANGGGAGAKTGLYAVPVPTCVAQRGRYANGNRSVKIEGGTEQFYEARPDGKTSTLTTVQKDNMVAEPCCMRYERTEEAKACRKAYEAHEIHHGYHELSELHPREDGKSNTLSTVLKDNPICEPVNTTSDGKSGLRTVRHEWELAELSGDYWHGDKNTNVLGKIECKNTSNNNGQPAQGTRVYNTDCKSTCLDGDSRHYIIYAIPCEWDENGTPIKAISGADGKTYTVYPVVGGQITIKEKTYPIKLADGYYIIRKLTVSECKRLQTVPDWYDFSCVSNTQAYKMLGNGWTCDVITHLIKACLREEAEK